MINRHKNWYREKLFIIFSGIIPILVKENVNLQIVGACPLPKKSLRALRTLRTLRTLTHNGRQRNKIKN